MAASLRSALLGAVLLACLAMQHAAAASGYRIVALGDSYTSGEDRIKRAKKEKPAPYTGTLKACLRQWTADPQLQIVNTGVSGAGVLIKPNKNLTVLVERQVLLAQLRQQPYDLAILWVVGINDMYNSKPPEPFPYAATLKKYLHLIDTVLNQGWRLVVMTQPGFIWAGQYSAIEARRRKMSDMLRKAVEADPREGIYFFDVEQAGLNVWGMSRARKRLLFERDQIHLTKAGSQMIGRRLCSFLAPLIKSSTPLYSPKPNNVGPNPRSPIRSPSPSPSPNGSPADRTSPAVTNNAARFTVARTAPLNG